LSEKNARKVGAEESQLFADPVEFLRDIPNVIAAGADTCLFYRTAKLRNIHIAQSA